MGVQLLLRFGVYAESEMLYVKLTVRTQVPFMTILFVEYLQNRFFLEHFQVHFHG